jgi:hypothetical protein
VTFVVVVQVNNCFILYRTSSFAKINDIPVNEHTDKQLEELSIKPTQIETKAAEEE